MSVTRPRDSMRPTGRTLCHDCGQKLVERVHGDWCPGCRGWAVELLHTHLDGSQRVIPAIIRRQV